MRFSPVEAVAANNGAPGGNGRAKKLEFRNVSNDEPSLSATSSRRHPVSIFSFDFFPILAHDITRFDPSGEGSARLIER